MKIRAGKVLSVFLALSMFTASGSVSSTGYAASKPKLNEKKVTINAGDYAYLAVNKVGSSKIKSTTWKTSDKSVASISKKSKTLCGIKGKKKGMAVITANVALKSRKKHVLTCFVTVKNSKGSSSSHKSGTPSGGNGVNNNTYGGYGNYTGSLPGGQGGSVNAAPTNMPAPTPEPVPESTLEPTANPEYEKNFEKVKTHIAGSGTYNTDHYYIISELSNGGYIYFSYHISKKEYYWSYDYSTTSQEYSVEMSIYESDLSKAELSWYGNGGVLEKVVDLSAIKPGGNNIVWEAKPEYNTTDAQNKANSALGAAYIYFNNYMSSNVGIKLEDLGFGAFNQDVLPPEPTDMPAATAVPPNPGDDLAVPTAEPQAPWDDLETPTAAPSNPGDDLAVPTAAPTMEPLAPPVAAA